MYLAVSAESILPAWSSGRWMPLVPGAQEDETQQKLWEHLERAQQNAEQGAVAQGDKHRLTRTGQGTLLVKSCCVQALLAVSR